MELKRVRNLLRVSSNQQLEADGDLTIQRQLVVDYVEQHNDWVLDDKEYFEGGISGYKNSSDKRDILQEILADAEKGEFDILVCYKDDRVGRRMWDIGAYVMKLKQHGVDIYTVKDGCISPQTDDIMGQMLLALRYGNAQKSSSDTGMRVKDTAQKLVQKGKYMGGYAPYGYEFVYSGEISKHGRALKKLQIQEEKADVIRHIYDLAYSKEYGSYKIALTLNSDPKYASMAPNDVWKSGTITSMLTNPIYAGYTAYKRRERVDGKIHRLDDKEWIKAEKSNPEITIVDEKIWNLVQDKRKKRSKKLTKLPENENATVIKKNDGILPLIDVTYCGYCGHKMRNGTKYNYWTIKDTGERRCSKLGAYKCNGFWEGIPHDITPVYMSAKIESLVFEEIGRYVEELQKNNSIFDEINKSSQTEIKELKKQIKQAEDELKKIENGINVMESHIPDAMMGDYPLTIDDLAKAITAHKEKLNAQNEYLEELRSRMNDLSVNERQQKSVEKFIMSWKDVFCNADKATQRVLIDRLVDRIDIKRDEITITYKINLRDF